MNGTQITGSGGGSITVDITPTSGSSNAVSSGGVFTALASKADTSSLSTYATTTALSPGLAGKQNTLTFDSSPTSLSTNPVTSGGVFTALASKADTSALTSYATTSALTSGLAVGKQDTLTSSSNITLGSLNVIGDVNIDTNLIDTDPTNNRVGINKSNPAYTLDVSGDVSATSYLVSTNTSNVVRRYALTLASGGSGQSTYTTQGTAWNYGVITWHSVAVQVGSGSTYNDFGWTSGSTITVPVTGIYTWVIHSNLNPAAAINMTFIMRVGGSTEYRYNLNAGASTSLPSGAQPAFASGVVSLAQSTTLDFRIRTGSTSVDLRTNTDFTRIFLTIVRVG